MSAIPWQTLLALAAVVVAAAYLLRRALRASRRFRRQVPDDRVQRTRSTGTSPLRRLDR